jgi:hypothetical protein
MLHRASSSDFQRTAWMPLALLVRSLGWEKTRGTRCNHSTRQDTCRTHCNLNFNEMAYTQPRWTYEVQRAPFFRKLVLVAIFREQMAILAEAKATSSTKAASKITKTSENRGEPRAAQGNRSWRLALEVAQLPAAAKSIFRISIMWYKTITQ